jgi:hypothetical protein
VRRGLLGCGGATCPFAPPSHHALVAGRVLTRAGDPVAGAFVAVVSDGGGGLWVMAPRTGPAGEYAVRVEAELADPAATGDTLRAWVRAAWPEPPPGTSLVADSVRVLVRLVPRGLAPAEVRADITLPLGAAGGL